MSDTVSGTVGPYRIERVLESTQTAALVDAVDTRLERRVWLKVLTAVIDAPARARFHREARALMAIEHPNVLMLHDYSGPTEAQPYIAYEPLHGPTLKTLLAEKGAMPKDVHLAFFLQVADGLATLHAQGLAHRNLSLDCLRLEEDGRVVIDDLASAADVVKSEGTLVSRGTVIQRSLLFTAPEVKKSGVGTLAGDVYALGVLMAAGWLGKPPIAAAGNDTADDLAAIARVSGLPDVPKALAEITDSIVHAKGERPTAEAVHAALAAAWTSEQRPEERLYAWLRNDATAITGERRRQDEARALLERGEIDRAIVAATAGRYEQLTLLGQGGMGRVVKAWDTRMKRWVAIKTMLDTSSADANMRFHREARALGRLRHPGIVEVIDYSGRGAALPFIVLEFVDGANFTAVLEVSLLPETAALGVMHDLCEAAAVIHAEGLVHRDLKPDNLFVEESGRVVIGDFGIVRGTRGKENTFARAATQSIGSPHFASPEQIYDPDSVTGASDVFSLGSVLHALLTGKSAFFFDNAGAVFSRLSRAEAVPLPSGFSDFTVQLRAQMLALDATARPTAAALRDLLRDELTRRRVLDPRQELRKFLGSEEADSQTRIFDSATRIGPRALRDDNSTAQLPSKEQLANGRKVRPRRWPLAAAAMVILLGVVALLAARGPRNVVASEPDAPRPADVVLPAPPTIEAPSIPAEPPPIPAEPPPSDEPKRRERTRPGVVRFITRPWAKVTIDGEAAGTTPVFQSTELAPGRHTVRFENPAFQTKTMTVEVKAGEQRDVRVQLEK